MDDCVNLWVGTGTDKAVLGIEWGDDKNSAAELILLNKILKGNNQNRHFKSYYLCIDVIKTGGRSR